MTRCHAPSDDVTLQVHRNADGRRDYSNLLREGQVTTELAVIDPSDA